ncbi:hypothetical protein HDU97_006366 [Phlyctochytrium planicorne]|nr:hypothetical protein HDU97_006366 [Phlyctochytrium planicorne]
MGDGVGMDVEGEKGAGVVGGGVGGMDVGGGGIIAVDDDDKVIDASVAGGVDMDVAADDADSQEKKMKKVD